MTAVDQAVNVAQNRRHSGTNQTAVIFEILSKSKTFVEGPDSVYHLAAVEAAHQDPGVVFALHANELRTIAGSFYS